MLRRSALISIVTVVTAGVTGMADPVPLVVHEWGTFTSVAGADGRAVEWTPQAGPSDLPCFVVRNRFNVKGSLRGTERMETPVLYFYAPGETRVNVRVRFNGGVITEWFPAASVTGTPGPIARPTNGSISWTNVAVEPALEPDFATESGPSHYYRARDTDASPVIAHGDRERFLFYRGVGTFDVPISAAVAGDGSVLVSGAAGTAIGDVIAFENRGGAIASETLRVDGDRIVLAPSAPQPQSAPPLAELEQILVAHGLFEREARAMVDTWRDSWFEEGARLLYIVPQRVVDAVLPLDIAPAPSSVTRVFVGRLELVTPATLQTVGDAIADGDRDALARYGRFLEPILKRIGATPVPIGEPVDRGLATGS